MTQILVKHANVPPRRYHLRVLTEVWSPILTMCVFLEHFKVMHTVYLVSSPFSLYILNINVFFSQISIFAFIYLYVFLG